MYSSVNTPSEPCSTPPGVDRQAKSDRMSVSHKESSASSAQLEYTDTGQLGPANSTRVYDRPNRDPPTNLLSPTNSYITRQSCSGDTGSPRADQERGNSRDINLSKQLHLPAIPGREERGGAATSYQPEGIEPVCSGGTLQNGRFTSPSRLNPARGLDDKNGPQGCLFASANPRSPSMFSPVCLGRETLQISVPTVWPIISTKSVYQTPETNCGPTQTDRPTVDNLFGRHALYACKQGTTRAHGTIDSESIRGPGPYGEQSEVTFNTHTTYRFLGISDQFMQPIALLTPGKGQENTTGSVQAPPTSYSISQGDGNIYRESHSNLQGTMASPAALQGFAKEPQFSDSGGCLPGASITGAVRQVHSPGPDKPRIEEGSSMVGNDGIVDTWHSNMYPQFPNYGTGIGCISERMGSTVYGNQHRGFVVNYRSTTSHQLPRVISCLPSPQDLCKQPEGLDLAKNGQCIGSDIHQPKGWNALHSIMQFSTANVGVVHSERDHVTGRAPAGDFQCSGRYRIPDSQGQMRLDDQPQNIPEITAITRPIRDRPVCISPNQATTQIFQLATGSRGGGYRCFSSELDPNEGLCQPPMVSNTALPEPDKATTGKSIVDNASVALPTLVPGCLRDVTGLPSSTSSSRGLDTEPLQSRVHNAAGDSNISRMAHLRKSFSSRGISAQASELLLSSWRDKTNTSYNSLFAKWANWCEQRDRNPTSGPVEDVVNFLAELFAKGYQYRSLNSYRSAISSIHQKVDGQSIGQHPLVCRLLKGSYNQKPPTPRYSHFWDVGVVLRFLKQLGTNPSLSLKWISIKTAMLMALTRPSRSADLSKLDMRFRTYTANGVIFQPTHLSKQSRSSKPIREFFFPFYVADVDICPVRALQSYEERTLSFREKNTKSTLFLSWIGKHDPVSSSTIARWLRMCLQEAGIDTDTFKAHSVRGAASSAAAWSGVTIMDILNAADWSTEATFQQFYHREMQDMTTFGSSVLSSASTSNLHVDMETEPSEM